MSLKFRAFMILGLCSILSAGGALLFYRLPLPLNLSLQWAEAESLQAAGLALMYVLGSAAVVLASAFWWLLRPLKIQMNYVGQMTDGERYEPPCLKIRELDELTAKIFSWRDFIESKARKEEFISGVIQELKLALATQRGWADQITLRSSDEDIGQLAHEIRTLGDDMNHTLQRVWELARVEEARELTKKSEVKITDLFQRLLLMFSGRLAQKEIELKFTTSEHLSIWADKSLLENAFQNLIENALDFSDDHSRIEVLAQEKRGTVEFIVRDEGSGVPDFALPFVFKRFYSLRQQKGQRPATGLGLTFVKEIAQLHKGKVFLSSPPHGKSQGTEVRLSLPRN